MSTDKLFLITAPAGNTGAPTVKILREAGHRVRAFVHRIDHRSEALAALGAEVVEGDLLDFRAVSSAMTGISAAYFCYPIAPVTCYPPPRSSPRPPARPVSTRWSTCPRYRLDGRRKAMLHCSIGSPSAAGPLGIPHDSPASDLLRRMAEMAMERNDTEGVLRLPSATDATPPSPDTTRPG